MTSAPPARQRVRDRHGRGARGPVIAPTQGRSTHIRWPSARERFDAIVLATVGQVEAPLSPAYVERLGLVEYAVEDAPLVPDDWSGRQVPLSALIRGTGTQATRLVIFRRPIEHRSGSREEVAALVHLVLVEQLAELLEVAPENIDPRYEA
jgi:Zincin-like metallopeptidase